MNPQQKAAKTKAEKAAVRVWEDVKKSRKRTGCTCNIRKGMTHDDLAVLGAGCTSNPWPGVAAKDRKGLDYGQTIQRFGEPVPVFVCATLDKYRRMVPTPVAEEVAA